ncbi:MAG: hypothetical protein JSS86_12520 [Cyanobacteria bacterium SZAS LIN-2]|nr:hypothetical protein [Cyanobacteria bacterium SZAS LIN-2]
MKKTKSLLLVALLAASALLTGCATPLGQQYGTAGALGGAIIGGATGGARGAIIGGTAGAIVGGAVGDQQSIDRDRDYRRGPPEYRPYPPRCYYGRVPVYDRYGYVVGYTRGTVCD